jgi:PKHD-type hydroxylase
MKTEVIGMLPPERPALPSHCQWTGTNRFLSPPECEAIRTYADALALQAGTIGNGSRDGAKEVPSYRRVETCSLDAQKFSWLYERIVEKVKLANNDLFRFDLVGIGEAVGYLKYTAPTEGQPIAGHYNWHQDFGGGPYANRKLSMVIQLSDPSEYDGCRLQLCTDGPWECSYIQQGDAIMFPSWTPHQVTEITRGERRALVVWITGPQFR